MKTKRHFSDDLLTALQESKGLRIRAGTGRHRFIGIWFVVVKDRVFVRSWSVNPDGWYRGFLRARSKLPITRPRSTPCIYKDNSLRDAVNRAYLKRYNTPGALRYTKDLGSAESRAMTRELVPSSPTH
jgi:hypothetical protein